jgi:hypothetical protein
MSAAATGCTASAAVISKLPFSISPSHFPQNIIKRRPFLGLPQNRLGPVDHHRVAMNRTGRKPTSIIMLRAAIPPAARFGNAPRVIGSGNLVALK